MSKPQQLSEKYTKEIFQEIKSGIYSRADRLPSEPDIAKHFGISRTMVRDCLSTLEREGFISRKHGIGTIINQHVLDVKGKADVRTAQKLGIKAGEDVVISVRLITADGAPAIYCVDHIARRSIVAKEYDLSLLDSPVFEFVEQYCGTEIYMDLSEISAVAADAERADVFQIPQGSPLLYIDELGYNFVGQPILYSQEYYANGIFKHTILRKKI